MSQHTPGPWEVRDRLDIYAGDYAVTVAHCYSRIRGESEANARLIAVSPTLYEYVAKKAEDGDAEAQSIIATI